MALYSLEHPKSPARLQGKTVLVDTSFLISLTDTTHGFHPMVNAFHQATINDAYYCINVITRQEFIKKIRIGLLVAAARKLAAADPALEARYQAIIGTNRPLSQIGFDNKIEALFKNHVLADDVDILLGAMPDDIWAEVERLEALSGMHYESGGGKTSWEELGELIKLTGLSSTDGMIVNFAVFIGANAIVTTDCDFAQVSPLLDVFMPLSQAKKCAVYSEAVEDGVPVA